MAGKRITIASADDRSFSAYLAMPESGSGPGLLLLHETSGIGPRTRALADLFAEEGYAVIAPDPGWIGNPCPAMNSGLISLAHSMISAAP
jgi:carboxymethylenebutenolidase